MDRRPIRRIVEFVAAAAMLTFIVVLIVPGQKSWAFLLAGVSLLVLYLCARAISRIARGESSAS